MKHWEIIADNLKKRGWSLGYVSAINSNWRTIWVADAHRDDGKRFVVHAAEKLTALLELESVVALAANCVDRSARFFPNSTSLNGSESGGGSLALLVLRLLGPRKLKK